MNTRIHISIYSLSKPTRDYTSRIKGTSFIDKSFELLMMRRLKEEQTHRRDIGADTHMYVYTMIVNHERKTGKMEKR
jgi:hypothetical protein